MPSPKTGTSSNTLFKPKVELGTPIAFKRWSDSEMLTINSDGKTYSLEMMKRDFPGHIHMDYTDDELFSSRDDFGWSDFEPIYKV